MSETLINTIEQLAVTSVQEVFLEMLDVTLTAEAPTPLDADPLGHIVGSVGFIGQVNGLIHLYVSQHFARHITSRMLGLTEVEVEGDDMVNDAIGELSNVVVGGVKSNLCDQGYACTLTVPSIVRGHQLTGGETSGACYRMLGFRNGEHRLLVEVVVKEGQD